MDNLRKFFLGSFDTEELIIISYDYTPEVYDLLTPTTTTSELVELLFDSLSTQTLEKLVRKVLLEMSFNDLVFSAYDCFPDLYGHLSPEIEKVDIILLFFEKISPSVSGTPPTTKSADDQSPLTGPTTTIATSPHENEPSFSIPETIVYPPPDEQNLYLEQDTARTIIPFRLQLIPSDEGKETFKIRILQVDESLIRTTHESQYPYTFFQLELILRMFKALLEGNVPKFTYKETKQLEKIGLANEEGTLVGEAELQDRVGQRLYEAITPRGVHGLLAVALDRANRLNATVALELDIDANVQKEARFPLAQYPWELLFDRQRLLLKAMTLSRHINDTDYSRQRHKKTISEIADNQPLKLLYIESRPKNLTTLDSQETQAVHNSLKELEEKKALTIIDLPAPTWECLSQTLKSEHFDMVHFDGHGGYQDKRGQLAFEDEKGASHWVTATQLGPLLQKQGIQLVVLSACWSSYVGETSLFRGVAPALILAGIPAVVSMQLPIGINEAVRFMSSFYQDIAQFKPVTQAVQAGQLRISDTLQWFIPTLYLNSQDNEGHLFKPKEQ